MKDKKNKCLVLILLALVVLIATVPLFLQKDADFGGSDDAASQMVAEITATEYLPWFTPVLETLLGRELPGEAESLLFSIQTGIGVAVIAFGFGYLVARKKYRSDLQSNPIDPLSSGEIR